MNRGLRLIAALVTTLVAAGNAAGAEADYPNRAIRLVVPFPAGGVLDALTRTLAPEVSASIGQPVLVDNKPGATGIIGTGEAARATPDGYTLLMVYDAHAMHPLLSKKLPYDPFKDFVPISLLVKTPMVAMANVKFPPNNLTEWVSYAKANPGKVTYGSVGIGSSNHLSAALFERVVGISMVHAPYKGGAPAQVDLIGGQYDVIIATPAFAKAVLPSKRVKLLGQMGPKRGSTFPDLATSIEQGIPTFEAIAWMGISAPRGTPQGVIDRWRLELNKALSNKAVVKKLNDLGLDVELSTPNEFGALIQGEHDKWARVLRELNINLE